MQRIVIFIEKLEDGFLALLVSLMVALAISQIIYRNLFDAGIGWIDPALRVLVLWLALAGAVIATRSDNHIRIDFFTRRLPAKMRTRVQRAVYLFSALVCGLVAWHAARFVISEQHYATVAFAEVPVWLVAIIMPLGFALMALRYLALMLSPPEPPPTL